MIFYWLWSNYGILESGGKTEEYVMVILKPTVFGYPHTLNGAEHASIMCLSQEVARPLVSKFKTLLLGLWRTRMLD